MNASQVIQRLLRMASRRLMHRGVDAGLRRLSDRGGPGFDGGKARRALRALRRIGRF